MSTNNLIDVLKLARERKAAEHKALLAGRRPSNTSKSPFLTNFERSL
jgi:hypothetical protein